MINYCSSATVQDAKRESMIQYNVFAEVQMKVMYRMPRNSAWEKHSLMMHAHSIQNLFSFFFPSDLGYIKIKG